MSAAAADDLPGAADAFTESVAGYGPVVAQRPDNVVGLQGLVSARGQLAEVERQRGHRAAALAHFTAGRRDLDRLQTLAPDGTDFAAQKKVFDDGIAALGGKSGTGT